jgi:hypothetical protein
MHSPNIKIFPHILKMILASTDSPPHHRLTYSLLRGSSVARKRVTSRGEYLAIQSVEQRLHMQMVLYGHSGLVEVQGTV